MKMHRPGYFMLLPLIIIPLALLYYFSPQTKNNLSRIKSPQRIVSLSPSVTRMIEDAGEGKRITGVTSFDTLTPGRFSAGNLISPNIETILLNKTDCVIFSEDDSAVQKIEQLESSGIPCVRLSRSSDFKSILDNYIKIAELLDSKTGVDKAHAYRKNYSPRVKGKKRILILVAHTPLVAASEFSFIGKIVIDAGGLPVRFPDDRPFPAISRETLIMLNPDCIITTDPGGKEELYRMLESFPHLSAVKNKSIYTISAETACYYTPRNYLETQNIMTGIFNKMEQPQK